MTEGSDGTVVGLVVKCRPASLGWKTAADFEPLKVLGLNTGANFELLIT
jgi:hypothetical protein